ncbi:hypothetical protein ACA758_00935 [Mycoplasmopsis agassizii]|uniref:hypothetical protein n=1 Tax=Mycoplasmopsis agassizii TaxID=33922 RepID=UPI0035285C42
MKNHIKNHMQPITKFNENEKGIYVLEIVIDKVNSFYYIGKTLNSRGFRARIQSHKASIKKYFEDVMEAATVNNVGIREGFQIVASSTMWDGKHLYTKIVKLLLDTDQTVDDIKEHVLAILDNSLSSQNKEDNELASMIELNYINKFETYIYGLNQWEHIICFHKLANSEAPVPPDLGYCVETIEDFLDYILSDRYVEDIHVAFGKFNFYHGIDFMMNLIKIIGEKFLPNIKEGSELYMDIAKLLFVLNESRDKIREAMEFQSNVEKDLLDIRYTVYDFIEQGKKSDKQ